jgi:ribonuclease HII
MTYTIWGMVIVGIDEVGRGCWAGPLVAGAVVIKESIPGLKDSKKLSQKQREALTQTIQEQALAIGLGWVDAATIDKVGITTAVKLAMQRALEQIKIAYDEVIIDGNLNFLSEIPKTRAVIKADDSVSAVSAASIVAKVARDHYMTEVTEQYPDYGFERHVGYGTALHLERLKLHGVSDLHRRSYKPIRALLE